MLLSGMPTRPVNNDPKDKGRVQSPQLLEIRELTGNFGNLAEAMAILAMLGIEYGENPDFTKPLLRVRTQLSFVRDQTLNTQGLVNYLNVVRGPDFGQLVHSVSNIYEQVADNLLGAPLISLYEDLLTKSPILPYFAEALLVIARIIHSGKQDLSPLVTHCVDRNGPPGNVISGGVIRNPWGPIAQFDAIGVPKIFLDQGMEYAGQDPLDALVLAGGLFSIIELKTVTKMPEASGPGKLTRPRPVDIRYLLHQVGSTAIECERRYGKGTATLPSSLALVYLRGSQEHVMHTIDLDESRLQKWLADLRGVTKSLESSDPESLLAVHQLIGIYQRIHRARHRYWTVNQVSEEKYVVEPPCEAQAMGLEPETFTAAMVSVCVIVTDNGVPRYLLACETSAGYQTRWHLPGGIPQEGESILSTAVRMLLIHTGIKADEKDVVIMTDYVLDQRNRTGVVIVYTQATLEQLVMPDRLELIGGLTYRQTAPQGRLALIRLEGMFTGNFLVDHPANFSVIDRCLIALRQQHLINGEFPFEEDPYL